MATFARALTRSWAAKLLSKGLFFEQDKAINSLETKTVSHKHLEENKRFLDESIKGGVWFS